MRQGNSKGAFVHHFDQARAIDAGGVLSPIFIRRIQERNQLIGQLPDLGGHGHNFRGFQRSIGVAGVFVYHPFIAEVAILPAVRVMAIIMINLWLNARIFGIMLFFDVCEDKACKWGGVSIHNPAMAGVIAE
ncbi:MAG: hypothetical protein Q9P14_10130 [candidate division KSB1 bacterium]|nr:hypothetical protein [candidate division KSB1 bacterium]